MAQSAPTVAGTPGWFQRRRLEVLRRRRGMTQQRLAAAAGVAPSAVSMAEKHAFATRSVLERLARALDVTDPSELLTVVAAD